MGCTKPSGQWAPNSFAQRYIGKVMKLIIHLRLLGRLRISRAELYLRSCTPSWNVRGEMCLYIRRTAYLASHLRGKVLKQLFPMSIWCISHLKILLLPCFWHIVWRHSCISLSGTEHWTVFHSSTLHFFCWSIESDSTWQEVSFNCVLVIWLKLGLWADVRHPHCVSYNGKELRV